MLSQGGDSFVQLIVVELRGLRRLLASAADGLFACAGFADPFVQRGRTLEQPVSFRNLTKLGFLLGPGQLFDGGGVDVSGVLPPDHEPAAVEDEADIVPVAQVIWLHVVIGMTDVEASGGQAPRVMTVVFPHAAGKVFEVGLFHDRKNAWR